MKSCPACNKTYDDSWSLCLKCGTELSREINEKKVPTHQNVAPAKKAWWKDAGYFITALVVLSLAGTLGKTFVKLAFNAPAASNASINIESLDWQRRELRATGISIESPVVLRASSPQIPQQVAQYVRDLEHYTGTMGDLNIAVSMVQYDDSVKANLDGAVNGAMDEIKKVVQEDGATGLRYDMQRTYVFGREGALITAECAPQSMTAKMQIRTLVFVSGAKAWMVQTIYADNENNANMSQRIISSIKTE